VIHCRRTIEDLRRISRLVGKWEQDAETGEDEEEAMIRKTGSGRYNTSIDLSVQSRDQVDFETRRKRFDDLLSAGRFCDWKARDHRRQNHRKQPVQSFYFCDATALYFCIICQRNGRRTRLDAWAVIISDGRLKCRRGLAPV